MSRCAICRAAGGYRVDIDANGNPCGVYKGSRCQNADINPTCAVCNGAAGRHSCFVASGAK